MNETRKPSVLAALLNRRMLICVFTGFSSGLPLFILLNLLPAWLKTEGMSLTAIGAMTLVQMPYTWKFLWSPLLDRYALPLLGRRRGWMLATQIGLLVSVAAFGLLSPQADLGLVVLFSVAVAFLSATQDIVLDAYRRELLPEVELGLGNAVHERLQDRGAGAGFSLADPRRPPALVAGVRCHRPVHAAGHGDDPAGARAGSGTGRAEDPARSGGGTLP